jgi:hypothetical protein
MKIVTGMTGTEIEVLGYRRRHGSSEDTELLSNSAPAALASRVAKVAGDQ